MDKETGRIEAFSDGVFAVAITLLALDLHVPRLNELAPGVRLGGALLGEWPAFLAYVTSFLTILVMWVNHHRLFELIRRSDHWFLIVNGLLLMGVTVIPFSTSLLAEYIGHRDASVAAAVFSGGYLLIALGYNLLWRYALRVGLLKPDAPPRAVETITGQYRFGPLYYLTAFILAFISVPASVGLALGLAVFFALPSVPGKK
ncbi:MAG: DUF1211 domain-containing protein [Armatimonadetes bacterium]|nr:DUF1211 domain-containing protein [Armatimonadota bacterium]